MKTDGGSTQDDNRRENDRRLSQGRRSFDIPAEALEVEFEVKKSRFIARAARANDRAAALALLQQAREDYPDARHHCWAYLIGDPHSPVTVAMSDDGEPSGTAGKPILNVLQHKHVGDVMLVVIRHFGGIKLGAGGLVRAYSQAAQQVMQALPTETQVPKQECRVRGDYALEQSLRHWLSSRDGHLVAVEYLQEVFCRIELPDVHIPELKAFVVAQRAVLLDDDEEPE